MATTQAPGIPGVTRRRFTVEEYHRMAEAGILHEDDRIELIEGEIIRLSAKGSRHSASINRCTTAFTSRLGGTTIVSVQNPVRTDEYGEPEPDLAVLRPRQDFYERETPTPRDVLLLVEVADGSIGYDRRYKLPLYTRARIPEVWIVDLNSNAIERYADPVNGAYRTVVRVARGEAITSVTLPGLTIPVDELLG
jgi:Uma2 family endonuclease